VAAGGIDKVSSGIRRTLSRPALKRAVRSARLLGAEYNAVTGDLAYSESDRHRDELHALRSFFRRAFQVLTYNHIEGDYAEFGCHGATTFTLAWGARTLLGHQAHLWALDSFEGLPGSSDPRDAHDGWTEGAMAMSENDFIGTLEVRGVPRADYTLVPGFYAETLADDSKLNRPERVCFAYVDCDLYSSTMDVLRYLETRLCHGAVIAFDDYYCFSQTHSSGERLAAAEVFADHPRWNLVPYLQWGWYGMSFMVEDKTTGPMTPFHRG
jgi:O-methyltransferase